MRRLQCFAHGRPGDWEAICTDLDLAVQGTSFEDVQRMLNEAVCSYVEDAMQESEETRRQLLKRRSPWHVRIGLTLRRVWRHPCLRPEFHA